MKSKKLFLVADLGLFRAYREVQGAMDRQPHLELFDEIKPPAANEKVSERLTDQAGRFPRGGGSDGVPGDLSAGERLKLKAEEERHLVGRIAERINQLLADDDAGQCALAASAPIHRQLLEAVDASARSKISQVIALDLTKSKPDELRAQFEQAKP